MTTPPMPTGEAEFLTEEQYDERFKPVPVPEDSNSIWEFDQIKDKPTNHVWSVTDVDGNLYAIPGWHVVNVIGYNLTEVPWTNDNIEVKFYNPHDDHEGDCDEQGYCIV